MSGSGPKRGAVALVGVVAVAGVVAFLAARGAREAAPPKAPADGRAPSAEARGEASEARGASGGERMQAAKVRRLASRAAYRELLARVRAAKARRLSSGGTAATGPAPAPGSAPGNAPASPAGGLDKDYVQQSVREIVPLLEECYAAALERVPDLSGRVAVTFTIEGEPEVGGVIGSSRIEEGETTLADPDFLECVQETMYAVEIDPPAGGGVVTVTYPFEFRPDGDDG